MNNPLQASYEQEQTGSVLAQASASREMEEVKGQIFMAKSYPRNVFEAERRILDACKRPELAQIAVYSYPRGGMKVEGPSIRLAEVLAQNWGNLSFGIKELEQRPGESIAMAYAWDLETNVRQERLFTVKHSRKAGKSIKALTDPRDIKEMIANQGARDMRSCILSIIPRDVVDKAVDECNRTLEGGGKGPIKDRIAKSLELFKEKYQVTQDKIEKRFGYNVDAFSERDLAELGKIYNSLKDGMSKVEDWFPKEEIKESQNNNLTDAFKQSASDNTSESKKTTKKADNKQKEDVKDGEPEQATLDV